MTQNDSTVLRGLVHRLLEHMHSQRNQSLIREWTSLNDLRGERPMVLVKPEGAWKEITESWEYGCEDPVARSIEDQILRKLYKYEQIIDDSTIDDFLMVPLVYEVGNFGVDTPHIHSDSQDGAYAFDPPIGNLEEDLDKLEFRSITVDRQKSAENFAQVQEAIGDLIDLKPGGTMDWTNGLTWDTIKLIGLEKLMLYMYDDPDGLHRLMAFMRDERMHWLDQMESAGTIALNNGADYIGSGNLGYTKELPSYHRPPSGSVRCSDTWGFAESQETVGVSPEMFGEFIFVYQKPLVERFGLSYYGCCEPVEKRFDYIRQIENLRCVSVCPWSDLEQCAQLLGKDYVYCRKPNPAPLCAGYDEKALTQDVRNTLKAAGDLNLMMIMKDTHTVQHEPERLIRWNDMVRREIDAYAGL